MSNIQIKEFQPSEFTEDQLNQLNRIPLVDPFLTRKDIRGTVTRHESRKQAVGLFFVGSALICLGHLCSTEMAAGTSLWIVYLGLIVAMYLFVTRIMWNNSVGISIRKLTNEGVAVEMERAKIFLLSNPFFYRIGNELYENVPKLKRFLLLQERAQADFRHLQTRVDGYRQQMEHLINQPHNPNVDEQTQKHTLEAMEVRLRVHSEALFTLHDNLQPFNSYVDKLLVERGNVKGLAKKDFNSGRLEGEYSSDILFDSKESHGLNIEKNMNRCLAVVKNTGIKWRQELAKIRGLPDPTLKNDPYSDATNEEARASKKKEEVKVNKIVAEAKAKTQKALNYSSGLFQASPIKKMSQPEKNPSKSSSKQDSKSDDSERLQKNIAI